MCTKGPDGIVWSAVICQLFSPIEINKFKIQTSEKLLLKAPRDLDWSRVQKGVERYKYILILDVLFMYPSMPCTQGEIENLMEAGIPDNSQDLVISNCVVCASAWDHCTMHLVACSALHSAPVCSAADFFKSNNYVAL